MESRRAENVEKFQVVKGRVNSFPAIDRMCFFRPFSFGSIIAEWKVNVILAGMHVCVLDAVPGSFVADFIVAQQLFCSGD